VKRFVNIFGLKIGIVGQNRFAGFSRREQAQQPRDREAQPPNARLARTHGWINRDALKCHGHKIANDAFGYQPLSVVLPKLSAPGFSYIMQSMKKIEAVSKLKITPMR